MLLTPRIKFVFLALGKCKAINVSEKTMSKKYPPVNKVLFPSALLEYRIIAIKTKTRSTAHKLIKTIKVNDRPKPRFHTSIHMVESNNALRGRKLHT